MKCFFSRYYINNQGELSAKGMSKVHPEAFGDEPPTMLSKQLSTTRSPRMPRRDTRETNSFPGAHVVGLESRFGKIDPLRTQRSAVLEAEQGGAKFAGGPRSDAPPGRNNPVPPIQNKKKRRIYGLPRTRPKRTLKGNEHTAKMLDKQIDVMIENYASYSMVGSLRQQLTGQSCLPKKHFEEQMINKKILIYVKTNYGTILLKSNEHVSENNTNIREALDHLNIEESDIIKEERIKHRFTIQVDTSALRVSESVVKEKDELIKELQTLIDEFEIYEDDDEKNMVTYITPRKYFMKKIWEESRLYLAAYNKCKDIFKRASSDDDGCVGTFPRLYEYKGVILNWEDITEKSSLKDMVHSYMEDFDKRHNGTRQLQYKQELEKISIKNNTRKLVYTLDGYDYIEM